MKICGKSSVELCSQWSLFFTVDVREIFFRHMSQLWTQIVEQFLSIPTDDSDQDSRQHLDCGVLHSFLSLWVKLLKFSLAKTCGDTWCEKASVYLREGALVLVRRLSLGLIPTGCFSKAVSVVNHSLPAVSQLVTCPPSHSCVSRHVTESVISVTDSHSCVSRRLAESVISVTKSLLSSVPVRSGVLLFGGTYCGQEDHGSSEMSQDDQWSVDGRGLRGVTLLIMKSCAVLMTCVDSEW